MGAGRTAGESGAGPRWLPGDPKGSAMIDRIVRVDHAGEYGATRIYAANSRCWGGTIRRPQKSGAWPSRRNGISRPSRS